MVAFSTPFNTIPFDKITTEHYLPAIEKSIEDSKNTIKEICDNSELPTFANTLERMENAESKLGAVSRTLFNLNSAETSEELQAVAQQAAPLLSAFENDIRLNATLFEKIKTVYESDKKGLSNEQLRLLEEQYKSFVRNGALLSKSKKETLREIDQKLAQLSLQFGEHVMADTNAFSLHITEKEMVKGIPETVLKTAEEKAKPEGKTGWIFTLDYPSYVPLMTYAENRSLRKKMRIAFGKRGFQTNANNNTHTLLEIVNLRQERAQLLGYDSHAAFVLENRMAKNEETVLDFLSNLNEKAKPKAKKEWDEIVAYGKEKLGYSSIEKWDSAFISEKIKQEKYAFNEEALKPYFPLEAVLKGVFSVAKKLYGLELIPNKDIPVYHKDVLTFEVIKNGEHHAVFYADFHPRPGKRDGAWMTSFQPQKEGQRPHVAIVCNFAPPTENSPSLLTFNEVLTLFHEFGHALHGILANTTYSSLSGTNVYWDFVELPSQIFENWCYQPEVLQTFAKHYKTGEPLPSHFIEKIKKAEQFQQGLQTLRQLSFGYLDLSWHNAKANQIKEVKTHEKEILKDFEWAADIEENCMSTAFSHIFQGGYAAGYYSYKWAEVLDADAFELFLEKGIFDPETAQAFHDEILSKGGTQHPMELYLQFRGKKPDPNALLKRAGLIEN